MFARTARVALTRPARLLSTLFIIAGIGLVLYPAVRVAYTGWQVGLAQAEALAAWESSAPTQLPAAASSSRPAGSSSRAVAPGSESVSPSSPLLLLSVPTLGLTRVVPEGASAPQLRRHGLGRISWTALPDRPGIVGIAGHRTTYGAPFFRVGKLRQGDQIVLTYRGQRFDYVVTEQRVVRPHQVEVLDGPQDESMIALVTCTPVYSAKYRLVVLGTLRAVTAVSSTP